MKRLLDLLPPDCTTVKLGDALAVEKDTIGWHVSTAEKDYGQHHPIPVLTANRQFILGYMADDPQRTYRASVDNPVIIFDQFTTASRWVDFPFRGKSAVLSVLKASEGYNQKYLYYVLQSLDYDASTHQQHWNMMSKLQIPLPPLEIQNQIVEILDAHSELAELQAERVRLLKLEKDVLLEKIFAPGEGFKFSLSGKSFDTADWASYQLSDCFTWENPGNTLVQSSNYDPSFATPVLTANKSFVLGYTDETDGIYPSSPVDPVIIFDDFTTDCKWVDFPFKAKSGALKFLKPSDTSTFNFFFSYLALKMNPFRPSTHQRHLMTVFAQRMRFPKIMDQQLISEYFREIDSRIKLEEERLQLLKIQSAVVLEAIFKN